jgi:hypothetical protein
MHNTRRRRVWIAQREAVLARRAWDASRIIEENLKDCTLIGDEQGFILRCMVYGLGI